jgi:uncharacterized Zn-finger protein
MDTFSALLNISTTRPGFYRSFVYAKTKKPSPEEIALRDPPLIKMLTEENQGKPKYTLETLPPRVVAYIERETRENRLEIDAYHPQYSIIRQLHLHMTRKCEKGKYRDTVLICRGPPTKEPVDYSKDTYLIQRMQHQACSVCGKVFTRLGRLNSHLARHSEERPHECQESGCPAKFKTSWELIAHQSVHTEARPYECQEAKCTAAFKTKTHLGQHARAHARLPFTCTDPTCTLMFETELLRQEHEKIHELFLCNDAACGAGFKTEDELHAHEALHGTRPLVELVYPVHVFVCQHPGCFKDFPTNRFYRVHFATHSEDRSVPCPDCSRTFKTNSELASHARTHDATKYPCKFPGCKKEYSLPENMRRHMKLKHSS